MKELQKALKEMMQHNLENEFQWKLNKELSNVDKSKISFIPIFKKFSDKQIFKFQRDLDKYTKLYNEIVDKYEDNNEITKKDEKILDKYRDKIYDLRYNINENEICVFQNKGPDFSFTTSSISSPVFQFYSDVPSDNEYWWTTANNFIVRTNKVGNGCFLKCPIVEYKYIIGVGFLYYSRIYKSL